MVKQWIELNGNGNGNGNGNAWGTWGESGDGLERSLRVKGGAEQTAERLVAWRGG